MATIYIDNQPHPADPTKNLLHAVLSLGLDLPYFCWHPALGSVGACRQCAVKQFRDADDKQGRIVMACMEPALDNARISIEDPEAKEFRRSVIEWLMTNHPHDCPVCDEGGECHLQDMTVMTGHAYRRFRFKKRTFNNQDLGPFINHEMNRCIQCYRCVRFYKDYAGGTDLDAFASHNHVYFGRHEDGVLESEFSGNLVEVCPTGVFTDKTLKQHYTRKWDLQSAPSVCMHCGLGCNTLAGARYGGVRRILNRYNGAVNGYFLCDRGRFGYEFTNHPERIRAPLVREGAGEPRVVAPSEAIERLRTLVAKPGSALGIGSPRASLESNFALRALVGPERFHHGVADREFALLAAIADILGRGPVRTPSLGEIERCDAVLVLGEDLLDTAPRMALAVRQAIRQQPLGVSDALRIPRWHDKAVRDVLQGDRGPLFIATTHGTRLDGEARACRRGAPSDLARFGFAVARALDPAAPAPDRPVGEDLGLVQAVAAALRDAERPLVIAGTSAGSLPLVQAAAHVAWALHRTGRKPALGYVTPEADSMGLALLGGAGFAQALETAAAGGIETLVVLENDLFRRADAAAVDRLLGAVANLVVLDGLETATSRRASLVLPAATFAEGEGTLVSSEGRAQRFFRVLDPDPAIREGWRWLDAARTDGPRFRHLDEVTAAIEAEVPGLAGVLAAAPLAHLRANGQKFPRSPRRFSGRTAINAGASVHEPKPPDDPDSPLAFSMEGFPSRPPPALVTHFWAPGWNSVQSLNKFQAEIGGPMRGGDPGRRLLEPAAAADAPYFEAAAADAAVPAPGELLVVPVHAIYGSEELSARSSAVASRVPPPTLLVNPADAATRSLEPGAEATLGVDGVTCRLTVEIRDDVPPGVVGFPAGRPGLPFLDLPRNGKLA